MSSYVTQNDLLLKNLTTFYNTDNRLDTMLKVINGESKISLRKRIKVYDSYK